MSKKPDYLLCYGDTHIRETSSYPPFNRTQNNGLTGELNNIISGFKWIESVIHEHEPSVVIHLGDMFHLDDYLSVKAIYAASIGLEMVHNACKEVGAKHLILSGNHDTHIEGDNRVTAIRSLCGYGTVIDEPRLLDHNKSFRLGVIPHTDSLDKAYEWILDGSNGSDLIITHLDFMGAVYENRMEAQTSLDPNTAVPVISGHIHLKQNVGNVWYPGSLIQRTFSRTSLDDAGGALLWDLNNNKLKAMLHNNMSRHYVKITDLGQLSDLDPERCILKVMLGVPKEEVQEYLKDYEYIYLHYTNKQKSDDFKTTYIRNELEKPEDLLRAFIAENRPEALDTFDRGIN